MPCWKNSSIFGDAPRVPLDREQRAQFRAKLLLNRRPGRLTIAAAQIGRILVDKLGPEGRLDPSIATLATLACVSQSTVKRALAQLKTFGFLDWARRLVRNSAKGWRCEQDTNAYVLRVPACEAHFAPAVKIQTLKKRASGTESSWEAQIASATRQLLALGHTPPAVWPTTPKS